MIYRRGIIISLSGPDGVGKSTTLNLLKNSLTGYKEIIIRNWRPGLLKSLHSLAGKQPSVVHTDTGLIIPRREAGRFQIIRCVYYWIDFVLGYIIKEKKEIENYKLICYDRSYLDVFVDPVRFGLSDSKVSRFLFKRVPKHDLSILLYDHPKKIFQRKPELPLDVIRKQIASYSNLIKENLINVIIKTDSPPTDIVNRLKELITYVDETKNSNNSPVRKDQIEWLNSIFVQGNQMGFSLKKNSPQVLRRSGKYLWLDLKDGRGYFFPVSSNQLFKKAFSLYTPQNIKSRFLKKLISWFSIFQLEKFLFPKIQMVGEVTQKENYSENVSFLDFLKKELGGEDLLFSISIGAPGPAQKPVLSVISRNKKEIMGYVKIGWNKKSIENVKNEETVLNKLSEFEFESFQIPGIIKSGSWHHLYFCYQSTLPNLKPYQYRHWVSNFENVFNELSGIDFKMLRIQDSAFWKELNSSVGKINNLFYSNLILKSIKFLEQKIENQLFPFAISHGDLTPWNIKANGNKWFVFDWEFTKLEAPFGWDLLRYFFHHYRFVEKYTPHQIFVLLLEDGEINHFIRQMFSRYKLDIQIFELTLYIYLVHELLLYLMDDRQNIESIMYLHQMINLMIYRHELQI